MKSNIIYIFLTFSILILFNSCDGFHEQIVPIEVNVEDIETILVINGQIEENSVVYVQLSYSEDIDFASAIAPEYEENAQLFLSTDEGQNEQLKYFSKGWYFGTDIKGKVGQTYTLNIDINDQGYSAKSTMFSAPGYKDAWIIGEKSSAGKGGQKDVVTYSEEWKVNDPSDTRNRYLFQWWTNGNHIVYRDWSIDDNRIVNSDESLRLFNVTSNPGENEYTVLRAAEIDKVTYDYFNMYEKIVRGLVSVESQTPYNPVSNFGPNTVGNFRAVAFSSAVLLTPPSLSGIGYDDRVELSFPTNEYFKSYNLYWDTKSGVDENSNKINELQYVATGKNAKYAHKSVTKGQTYYYRIQSLDANGNISVLSPEISIIADGEAGSTDTYFNNLKATSGSGKITLSWDNLTDAQYYIYWDTKTGVDSNSKLIYQEGLKSPYVHTGLTKGETYYYIIGAKIGNTNYFSDEINAIAN